jgi:hypothetical protein
MFKNELELRSRAKSLGTVQHALAVMYTIGVYKDLSKLNEPTFIPRLDYDDVRLVDGDSQIDSTAKHKYYNMTKQDGKTSNKRPQNGPILHV